MAFPTRELSRAQASPVKLFLFKGADATAESFVRSVTLMPTGGEYGLGTTGVTTVRTSGGNSVGVNANNRMAGGPQVDFLVSLTDLVATFPNLVHVNIQVPWYGSDLRCGECQIRPKVTAQRGANDSDDPYGWQVGSVTRSAAQVVSTYNGLPAFQGTPSDRSLYECITTFRSAGIAVTLTPIIQMDIPAGSGLPSPWGGNQGAYPHHNLISITPAIGQPSTADQTMAAATQINLFMSNALVANFSWNAGQQRVNYSGPAAQWAYERFILHYATLAEAAGANELMIGTGLSGLTNTRRENGQFYMVTRLSNLATEVRDIVSSSMGVSYSAEIDEYHSHHADGNVYFHMDTLWANPDVSFIGINYHFPLSDWREGRNHADWNAGFTSIYDYNYLKANVEGGEGYDWRYNNMGNRNSQTRTNITDPLGLGKPWVYRIKDMRNWWKNLHYNRTGSTESSTATAWTARMKPIRFTEFGCAAVNKGSNNPRAVFDNKSSSSSFPYYSTNRADAAIQRAYVAAALEYWYANNEAGFLRLDRTSVMGWDARPYPAFPDLYQFYGDWPNYERGYHLQGRFVAGRAYESGTFGPYAFCDGETSITRAGQTFIPWPIQHSDITSAGDLDNSDVTIQMALRNDFMTEFSAFPPSQVVNLTIFQGHVEDPVSLTNYPALWLGRVNAFEVTESEINLNAIPVSTSIQRPGLRRNYQTGCPHVLYGPQCRAIKTLVNRTVAGVSGPQITTTTAIATNTAKYRGGTVEWTNANNGRREIRTVINTGGGGTIFTIRGNTRGLTAGATVSFALGCGRNMGDCLNLHNNIHNFGGQPWIPLDNPLSSKNQFY